VEEITDSRRDFQKASESAGFAALGSVVSAQSFDFKPNQRYPDPSVQILDPSFSKYRIYSSSVEQVGTGMRWAEGPVWLGDGRYLLVSDIPNNRIMRYDEATGTFGMFRHPAIFSNGMARDRQGRLLVCEHLTRSVSSTEYDG
jgi:gluconolactonase